MREDTHGVSKKQIINPGLIEVCIQNVWERPVPNDETRSVLEEIKKGENLLRGEEAEKITQELEL